MTQHLEKLVRIGSAPLAPRPPDVQRIREAFGEEAERHLGRMLNLKNGFYAFEGALHVLPDVGAPPERGLHDWNARTSWRQDYSGLADDAVFFAEDVFGMQFCLREGAVATFDPETGGFERTAAGLEEWAEQILSSPGILTGHPVARAWQMQHRPLPPGMRLFPIKPFVTGGEFTAENVHALDALKGMRYSASIAKQLRDLPDGTRITLKVVE